MNACPPGELAVGFEGRSGLFVDALALACAPSPTQLKYNSPPSQAGNMTTLQRPGRPAGPAGSADPSLQAKVVQTYPTILSPPVGQRYFAQSVVPIKLAPPPQVSATNYEVTIQRKDASGNWLTHHTFPVGAVETQSPTGYTGFGAGGTGPSKSTVLMTSPGSWRFQARVIQPTPMAWSHWAEFVVEPVLSKGSIVQTLSQGIGGAGLMRRGINTLKCE